MFFFSLLKQDVKSLTLSYCHVTYTFQSEPTLYSCLNLKELLARNRRDTWNLKGTSATKTITCQNVSSEAQIKNFFISYKNYVPFSRYSSFCIFIHPMIYRICDVTMSIVYEARYIFEYLLNHNSWSSYQTLLIDTYKQGQ